MRLLSTVLIATVLAVASVEARLRLGLAWGTDNRWAKNIAKGNIEWYWHWQEGPVDQMPSNVQFVPNFWGTSKWDDWSKRKAEMKKNPATRILAFNEPDIDGQASMNPEEAAQVYMEELHPYQKKGVKVSTPQIVWDIDWMDKFLKAVRRKGGEPDFVAVHWYGSYQDLKGLQTWIKKVHKRYNKSVWLTEYGVTAKCNPSQNNIKNFHIKATEWLASQAYVKRAAWLGCFAVSKPPDSFAAARNAFFNSSGALRKWAAFYVWSKTAKREIADSDSAAPAARSPGALRHTNARSHRAALEFEQEMLRRDDDDDEDDGIVYTTEAEHCEELCQKRKQALAALADDDELDNDDDLGDIHSWVD